MPLNEFGEKLDRNGYAPTLFQQEDGECFLCGKQGPTERHEVFGSATRDKSKAYGLWVPLCGSCHRTSPMAVHQNKANAHRLKSLAQRMAMIRYDWTKEEFIKRFYKNYLED